MPPVERFVLRVLLAERQRSHCLTHFIAEVERMRRAQVFWLGLDELIEDFKRIGVLQMQPGSQQMNFRPVPQANGNCDP